MCVDQLTTTGLPLLQRLAIATTGGLNDRLDVSSETNLFLGISLKVFYEELYGTLPFQLSNSIQLVQPGLFLRKIRTHTRNTVESRPDERCTAAEFVQSGGVTDAKSVNEGGPLSHTGS